MTATNSPSLQKRVERLESELAALKTMVNRLEQSEKNSADLRQVNNERYAGLGK